VSTAIHTFRINHTNVINLFSGTAFHTETKPAAGSAAQHEFATAAWAESPDFSRIPANVLRGSLAFSDIIGEGHVRRSYPAALKLLTGTAFA